MSQFSVADIKTDQLTAQARWTLENLALPMIEDDLSLEEAAQRGDVGRKHAGQLMQALREEILAQRDGPRLPELRQDDYETLKESIRQFGQQVPILLDQHGHILDGNHRQRACRELGLEPISRTVQVDSPEEAAAIGFIVNVARRQLTTKDKRNVVAAALLRDPQQSDRGIGAMLGVSHPHVATVRRELQARASLETVTSRQGRDGRTIDVSGIGQQQAALPAAQPQWNVELAGDIALSIRCADGTVLTSTRKFKQVEGMRAATNFLIADLVQQTVNHYTAAESGEEPA